MAGRTGAENLPAGPRRSGPWLAVVLPAVALAGKLVLPGLLGPPYILFYPAVTVVAMLGGLGPGAAATLLSAVLAAAFVLPAQDPARGWLLQDGVGLAGFVAVGLLISVVSERGLRARRDAVRAGAETERLLQEQRYREREAAALRAAAEAGERATRAAEASARDRDRLAQVLEAMRQRDLELEAAQRLVHVGSWYIPRDGTVATPTDELKRIFGLEVGQPMPSFAEMEGGLYPAESWSRMRDAIRATATTGQPSALELPARRADGTPLWLGVHLEPVRDAAGEVQGMRGTVQDLTELRRTTQALAEERGRLEQSEQRAAALFAQAPVAIALSRPSDGVLVDVNDAFLRLFGHRREEVLGQSTLALGMNDARTREQLLEALGAGRPVRDVELHRSTAAGEALVLSANVDLVHLGAEAYLLSSLQDLTPRRRAEEALRQAEERARAAQRLESVGRLAGGVAHDFNNLLTVILSCGEALEDQVRGRLPADPEDVEQLLAAARRARDLTRQLLAFARRQVVAPVPLDLGRLVAGAEKLLARLLGEDVALEVAPAPGRWQVRSDPAQLEQVLLNLAVNARDAMPRGGTLRLSVREVEAEAARAVGREGEWVVLAVKDSGVGLTEEARAHLFEPFFTTKGPGQGTGLGLATVYGIVAQAGGLLEVQSAPGAGTTFEVWLPRWLGPGPTASPAPPAPSLAAPAGGGEAVLVVEDDEAVRSLGVRLLREAGYQVRQAALPAEALALPPDELARVQLLVTDVVMPGMDGGRLAGELRRRHPALKVLFVSGYSGDALAARGELPEGVELLAKPFVGATLLARVRAVLDAAAPPAG